MSYRPHPVPTPGFFGYDPVQDLPQDHLARFIELVVQESIHPSVKSSLRGRPEFDPRLLAKVFLYAYSTGIRSSRQIERLCNESLPFLFLTRGDTPCYHTLCTFRVEQSALIEQAFVALFRLADQLGVKRLGQITIDSTKIRADASPEAVVKQGEFAAIKAELERILAEAAAVDAAEDNQSPGQTRLQVDVSTDHMRDILRHMRKKGGKTQAPTEAAAVPTAKATRAAKLVSPRMKERIRAGIAAITAAEADGRKHVCLTDPDARMMGEGREKRICECHSYEVAVDNGLLVAGQITNSSHDNPRLLPLVEAARASEPDGVSAVDADSGYFSSPAIAQLIEAGVDVCIPDTNTACDLHRDQPVGTTLTRMTGSVRFDYDEGQDVYTCPQGNVLGFQQTRTVSGKDYRIYRAQRSCTDCPLRSQCGRKERGEHRTLHVLVNKALLTEHLDRFSDDQHKQRYRRRAPAVETVFGFLRGTLGYVRWRLRGDKRVACEARLFKAAYQVRKIHRHYAEAMA
jgi:transposase